MIAALVCPTHRKKRVLVLTGLVVSLVVMPVQALTPAEFQTLQTAVVEICRGGTTSGNLTRTEVRGQRRLLTVNGLFESGSDAEVTLTTEQWDGIQTLIIDSQDYVQCATDISQLLAPIIDAVRNIDTDLNVRLEYITSPIFCDRLRHVVEQAPQDFSQWRSGSPTRSGTTSTWTLEPFLMGDPSELGMTENPASSLKRAEINATNDSDLYFREALVYTALFQAQDEASFIFDRISDAINSCFTFRYFDSVRGVRLSGGPYRGSSGSHYWSFDETGRIGQTRESFLVWLSSLRLSEPGLVTDIIEVRVHAPD